MEINEIQKEMLRLAQEFCDEEDKSTEFMIAYMQDMANADFDTVMEYLRSKGGFK